MSTQPWPQEDLAALRAAKQSLESPGILIRLADKIGVPVEYALTLLPPSAANLVQSTANKAISKTLEVALKTLDERVRVSPKKWLHKMAVVATGGSSGAFGLPALPLELPVTTGIIMRSIAEIARAEGEDLDRIETKLACLEVFALGSSKRGDDAAEGGYFAVRAMLAKAVSEAVDHIARQGLTETGAPVLVRLIAQIASRFGVQVSEKAAAQLMPAVGALGGASINLVFMDHFQKTAQGHFTIRRLERRYGIEAVKELYATMGPRPRF